MLTAANTSVNGPAGDGRGHVADDGLHRVAPRLGPQSLDHRRRGVDADDAHTARRERQRQTAGADSQFEHGSAVGQAGQALDGRVELREFAVPLVVDVGHGVAVARRPVAVHCSSSRCGRLVSLPSPQRAPADQNGK